MPITFALVLLLCLTLFVAWTVWWATRRLHTVGLLKDATVSRQWLNRHQGDE